MRTEMEKNALDTTPEAAGLTQPKTTLAERIAAQEEIDGAARTETKKRDDLPSIIIPAWQRGADRFCELVLEIKSRETEKKAVCADGLALGIPALEDLARQRREVTSIHINGLPTLVCAMKYTVLRNTAKGAKLREAKAALGADFDRYIDCQYEINIPVAALDDVLFDELRRRGAKIEGVGKATAAWHQDRILRPEIGALLPKLTPQYYFTLGKEA